MKLRQSGYFNIQTALLLALFGLVVAFAFPQFDRFDDRSKVAEAYHLEQVQVSCGDHSIPTATVSIRGPDGTVHCDADHGAGPVDAVYRAINRVIGEPNELIEFSIQAVTEGLPVKVVVPALWERFIPHFTRPGKLAGRVISIPDEGTNLQLGGILLKIFLAQRLQPGARGDHVRTEVEGGPDPLPLRPRIGERAVRGE